jgi:ATP-dependent DNA ligase
VVMAISGLPSKVVRTDVRHLRTPVLAVKGVGYSGTRPLENAIGADLLPQRPKYVRERPEPSGHILEPEWTGTRVLVRVGEGGPRFTGYTGQMDGPRELYDAIVADTHASTAIFDGVLVDDWRDESELEIDAEGNATARTAGARRIFAAFDLLEVDGESLVTVPLLERRRHLEGVLAPSLNVRLTPFVSRNLRSWRDTLGGQGFRRVVLKNWNSTYAPGRTTNDWLVVEKINPAR